MTSNLASDFRAIQPGEKIDVRVGIESVSICGRGLKVVAIGGCDGSIIFLDLFRGTMIRALKGHFGAVTVMEPVGSHLVSGSADSSICIWDTSRLMCLKTISTRKHEDTRHTKRITSLTATTQYLASGSADQSIRLWDLRTQRHQGTLTGHTDTVSCLAPHLGNPNLLASAGWDKKLKLWDLRTLAPFETLADAHEDFISCMCYHPESNLLVTGAWDGHLKFWEPTELSLRHDVEAHHSFITSVSPLKGAVLSAGYDKRIHIWNPMEATRVGTLTSHICPIISMRARAPAYIVSAQRDSFRLWS